MKTFLENLKKELKKRQFSKEDIEEIIADHKEMIESAKEEGLSDDELHAKFGDPEQLATDLLSSRTTTEHKGGETVEGYTLFKTFPVLETNFNVTIELVSEDVKYVVHELDQIEVHQKGLKEEEDYTVSFENNTFLLKRNKGKSGWKSGKSPNFVVKVPQGVQSDEFTVKIVSGDAKLEAPHAKTLSLHATSGDIKLKDFFAETAQFRTVSGDFELSKGELGSLDINMVSGDCEMQEVTVKGNIDCNTVSGDLDVKQCECQELDFGSVSGDCNGKDFYPTALRLKSVSGDVRIKNSDTSREITIVKKRSLSGKVKIN